MATASIVIDGHRWYRKLHAADAFCTQSGDKCLVALQASTHHGLYLFGSFPDHLVFYRYVAAYPYFPSFYEVLRPEERVPFYLDVEWYSPGQWAEDPNVHEHMKDICQTFEKEYESTPHLGLVVEKLSRPVRGKGYKNSYHLVCHHVQFGNAAALKALVLRLYGGNAKVDKGVYTRFRLFRCHGSVKAGEQGVTVPKGLERRKFLQMRLTDLDHKCRVRVPPLHLATAKKKRKATFLEGPKIRGPAPSPAVQTEAETKELANLKALLGALGGHGEVQIAKQANGLYVGRGPRRCPISSELHTSNGFYCKISEQGTVNYCCHGKECKGQDHYIGTLGDEDKGYWRPGTHITKSDAKWVAPYKKRYGQQALVVEAGMGKGKTVAAKALADEYIKAGKRVLVISCRITASNAFKGVFGGDFAHYKEATAGELNAAQGVIIQYESIWKLKKPFHLIIIDEARSIVSNMVSVMTNGPRLRTNGMSLQWLCTQAAFTVFMGADIGNDGAVPDLVHHFFHPSVVDVIQYTVNRLERDLVFMNDETKFLLSISEAVDRGECIMVGCRTKSAALALANRLRDEVGISTLKVYTGDSDDKEIADFDDIDDALQDTQIVIMTSKCTVGASCTLAWDRCYIHAKGQGCSARNLLQMIGRFRNVKYPETLVFVAAEMDAPPPMEQRYQDAMHTLQTRKRLTERWAGYLGWTAHGDSKGELIWAPDFITRQFAWADTEAYSGNIIYDMGVQAIRKQFTTAFRYSPEDINSDEIKQGKAEVKEEAEMSEDQMYEELSELDNSELLNRLVLSKERITKQEATQEDRLTQKVGHVLKHFSSLPLDVYKKVAKAGVGTVYNLKLLADYPDLNDFLDSESELKSLLATEWVDICGHQTFHQIQLLCGLLDRIPDGRRLLSGSGSSGPTLDKVYFGLSSTQEDVLDTTREIGLLLSRRPRQSKGKTPLLKAIAALRRVLNRLFGYKLVTKQGQYVKGQPRNEFLYTEAQPELLAAAAKLLN